MSTLRTGLIGAAHDALHAVDGAQIVAAVDAFAAACADQNVLGVVGHADDFMGHDLADGENEIESALRNEPVHLRGPRVISLPSDCSQMNSAGISPSVSISVRQL